MAKKNQQLFFSSENFVKTRADEEWVGMPEYKSEHEPKPQTSATFHFASEKDFLEFEELLRKHKIFKKNKKIFNRKENREVWYPEKSKSTDFIWKESERILPRFPVYIVSRGRYEKRYTADLLESMGVPYFIVVRKDEYKKYKKVVKGKVLCLPEKYIEEYDTFWYDDDPRTGAGPSRNFAWDHSIKNGFDWHWVLDDNIEALMRFNNNLKVKCKTANFLNAMEEFVTRYNNIAIAGPHYSFFIAERSYYPAYVPNTRIMSFLLIRNDIPFRWRGRYSEDVDISLRVLKEGWATVQFNAFLQRKMATQTCKGGCNDEFYSQEGTYLKTKMLVEMHPDVVRLTQRYNRDHHYVDYRPFKNNPLNKKENLIIDNKINEFNMVLKIKK